MASQIKTIGINGIEGYVIDVQVKVLGGPFTKVSLVGMRLILARSPIL